MPERGFADEHLSQDDFETNHGVHLPVDAPVHELIARDNFSRENDFHILQLNLRQPDSWENVIQLVRAAQAMDITKSYGDYVSRIFGRDSLLKNVDAVASKAMYENFMELRKLFLTQLRALLQLPQQEITENQKEEISLMFEVLHEGWGLLAPIIGQEDLGILNTRLMRYFSYSDTKQREILQGVSTKNGENVIFPQNFNKKRHLKMHPQYIGSIFGVSEGEAADLEHIHREFVRLTTSISHLLDSGVTTWLGISLKEVLLELKSLYVQYLRMHGTRIEPEYALAVLSSEYDWHEKLFLHKDFTEFTAALAQHPIMDVSNKGTVGLQKAAELVEQKLLPVLTEEGLNYLESEFDYVDIPDLERAEIQPSAGSNPAKQEWKLISAIKRIFKMTSVIAEKLPTQRVVATKKVLASTAWNAFLQKIVDVEKNQFADAHEYRNVVLEFLRQLELPIVGSKDTIRLGAMPTLWNHIVEYLDDELENKMARKATESLEELREIKIKRIQKIFKHFTTLERLDPTLSHRLGSKILGAEDLQDVVNSLLSSPSPYADLDQDWRLIVLKASLKSSEARHLIEFIEEQLVKKNDDRIKL